MSALAVGTVFASSHSEDPRTAMEEIMRQIGDDPLAGLPLQDQQQFYLFVNCRQPVIPVANKDIGLDREPVRNSGIDLC